MAYQPFSADGHEVRWSTWDEAGDETTTITWENEGWTVSGLVSQEEIQYVIRLTATWQVSQFLLFRDLDEPDLWLGTDGSGHWGEVNGAHRPELDGCVDIDLICTPFTHSLPIRRLPLGDGETAIVPVLTIDPETLATGKVEHRYTRVDQHHWLHHTPHFTTELEVDDHGLVLDYPDGWRRR